MTMRKKARINKMKHMVTCTNHKLEEMGFNYGDIYEVVNEGDDKTFTVLSGYGEYRVTKKSFKDVGTQENMILVQGEIKDVFDEANVIIHELLSDLTDLKILDEEENAQ